MNFLVISIPSKLTEEKIQQIVAEMCVKFNVECDCKIIESDEIIKNQLRSHIEEILDSIITVIKVDGSTYTKMYANLWRLIADGKVTKQMVSLLLDNATITKEFLQRKKMLILWDLLSKTINIM